MSVDLEARIRNVTAVLGPTNTGKTHLAIERMLGHASGMIGLPLRLLAREVYDKIGTRVGFENVALVTGEEKIKPKNARYWVSTVEAMPRDIDVDFLAIDEIQLAADPERGHVFTDRLLQARGRSETLLLGAQTMRDVIQDLVPGANFISRPRLSMLTYAGDKKITRLPTRAAIVAFSAAEVYSLAELIRRQRGGAAVVLGALSPRTRNAQVGLYQSGEVDFLVATDAIGMGLNLDLNHVAFAGVRKFDGQAHRDLTPSELAQIAGRAGRHMNDGTFGVTGSVEPLDPSVVEQIESHSFEPVRMLQWRNRKLDFASVQRLQESLRVMPDKKRLMRARTADDVEVLELASRDSDVSRSACAPGAVARLWDVCQVPDYRKISVQAHADLVVTLFNFLMGSSERIDEDWFAEQVSFSDKTDGDIDTIANRIAHIRTWTYVSNRADWLKDPVHWQGRTREVEEQLSDALHARLTQRFVDRRTSALMKGMRDKDTLTADIGEDGTVHVEQHFVGKLSGFQFAPDVSAEGIHVKATRNAAAQVLAGELAMRVRRVVAAKNDAFKLSRGGDILWRDDVIGRIEASDDLLKPTVVVIVDEDHVAAAEREKIQVRLNSWIEELVAEKLKPLVDLVGCEDVSGLARGIAFRLVENFGILKRELVAGEIKSLDQPARAQLRKFGVRFGAFNIFVPLLLKPASAELAATLWAVKNAGEHGLEMDKLPDPPRAGLTSFDVDPSTPEAFYRVYGYQVCGPRVVRLDILERLADQIRPLLAWRRKGEAKEEPPKGSTGEGAFKATPEMMSILGCSSEELSHVLKALGFRVERRPIKVKEKASEISEEKVSEGATASGDEPATSGVAKTEASGEANQREASVEIAGTCKPAEAGPAEKAGGDQGTQAPTVEVGATEDAPSSSDDVQYEEIWRPNRHRPRHDRRGRGGATRKGDQPSGERSSGRKTASGKRTAPSGGGKDRTAKGNGQRSGQKGRRGGPHGRDDSRQDRSRGQKLQSSGPRKKVELDPDSPFAALGALKDSMSKSGPSEDKS